jgi:hypothetical protein
VIPRAAHELRENAASKYHFDTTIFKGEFAAMDSEPWQAGGWFHDVRNRVAGSQALRRDHTHKTTMNIMMAVVIGST